MGVWLDRQRVWTAKPRGDLRPMRKRHYIYVIFLTTILILNIFPILYGQRIAPKNPILKINQEYEKRTVVKTSTIPHAGNGLFAVVKINKGEVIGELGGRLITDDDPSHGNHYVASIAECAWEKTYPYKHIDSKDYGGNVSRANFAPSEINGIATGFQNATIEQICQYPYFILSALRDIEPGEEIWSSYGPNYDYDNFMTLPEVRDFFCGLLDIDCSKEFTYSY